MNRVECSDPHRKRLGGAFEHGTVQPNELEAAEHGERCGSAARQLALERRPTQPQSVEHSQTLHTCDLAGHGPGDACPCGEPTPFAEYDAQNDG